MDKGKDEKRLNEIYGRISNLEDMKMEKETLSDKTYWEFGKQHRFYLEKDVKEAVERVKEEIGNNDHYHKDILHIINKIFGDKLI